MPVIIILALIPNLKFKVRNELCNYKYTIDLKLVFIIYMNRQQLWKENFPVQIPPASFDLILEFNEYRGDILCSRVFYRM
jgi:hypothetical protein